MQYFTHSLDGRTFISNTWLGPYPNSDEAMVYEFDDLDDARVMLSGFCRIPCVLDILRSVIQRLEGPSVLAYLDDARVLEVVARMLVEERLFLLETPQRTGTWPTVPYPEEEDEEQATQLPQTWVEIQLIGEDNAPIVGEKFTIALPDRSTVEVTTRSNGVARVGDYDSGDCEVEAVVLEDPAWERVE